MYHEPFVGGGALFFELASRGRIRTATLSDSNQELINAYGAVRDDLPGLLARLQKLEEEYLAAADRAEFYYAVRSEEAANPIARAARLIFLNKTCFNGLYRVNQSGHFNVPHGRYARPRIRDGQALQRASKLLALARLEIADFEAASERVGAGDLVYFDPPYHPISETARFTSYTAKDFGWTDQTRLADAAKALADQGAYVIVSNSSHPDVIALYRERGFHIERIEAPRSINSKADRRGPVAELLARAYPRVVSASSSPKKNRSQGSRSAKSITFPVPSR